MKYVLIVKAEVSLAIEVEADDLDAALGLARDAGPQNLCHQCASAKEGTWCLGEIDCDPSACELVDLHVADGSGEALFKVAAQKWAAE